MIYQYYKLVRDKIPENIKASGKKCSYHTLNQEEYKKELDKKLLEEVHEFLENHDIEEMADLLEVIEAIQKNDKMNRQTLEKIKIAKKNKKGGFTQKIYLEEVEEEEE